MEEYSPKASSACGERKKFQVHLLSDVKRGFSLIYELKKSDKVVAMDSPCMIATAQIKLEGVC